MLEDSDARVARVEYGPYGIMAVARGAVPGVLFTGKPWDEDVGMYAFAYRHYSPASARWLTRDPLGMVDGPNMYAYVMGNPVLRFDELGGAWITVITKIWGLAKNLAKLAAILAAIKKFIDYMFPGEPSRIITTPVYKTRYKCLTGQWMAWYYDEAGGTPQCWCHDFYPTCDGFELRKERRCIEESYIVYYKIEGQIEQ